MGDYLTHPSTIANMLNNSAYTIMDRLPRIPDHHIDPLQTIEKANKMVRGMNEEDAEASVVSEKCLKEIAYYIDQCDREANF
jgi:hypothetical protein